MTSAASKAKPSVLASSKLDEDAVQKELERIVKAYKHNGCSCDILLSAITTVSNRGT